MSRFDELFNALDMVNSIFDDDATNVGHKTAVEYSLPAYPPCEMLKAKDGTLTINFAVAGFKKEDLEITFDENKVVVKTVDDYKVPELAKDVSFIGCNRIKKSAFKTDLIVPESKFNFGEITAKFENGILSLIIPPKEKREYKPVSIA